MNDFWSCPSGITNLKLSSEDCPKEKFVSINRKISNICLVIFSRYVFYLTNTNPAHFSGSVGYLLRISFWALENEITGFSVLVRSE